MNNSENELDLKLQQQQRRARREEMKRRRKRRQILIYAALALLLCLVLILSIKSCAGKASQEPPENDESTASTPQDETQQPDSTPPKTPDATATLCAVGDIMCYDEQLLDAEQDDGTYDFRAGFENVKGHLSAADLTIANLETNFAGEPYTGYPSFSSPDALASALAEAGVDLLQTANTYALENGVSGLRSTLSAIEKAGMTAVGTYGSQEEAEKNGGIVVREINGIRFAFLAFTKGVNGHPLPEDSEYCVNVLYTDYMYDCSALDEETLLQSVKSAKEQKPDVIVALLHWGSEYDVQPTESQNAIADLLFQNGADVILGSHSHVVGPMEERTVTTLDGETKHVFIAYSLGNFFSAMMHENTQASVMLNLQFEKSGETGETTISKAEYAPVYLADQGEDAENRYVVYEIADAIDRYIGGADGKVSETIYKKMKDAQETLRTNAGAALEAGTN